MSLYPFLIKTNGNEEVNRLIHKLATQNGFNTNLLNFVHCQKADCFSFRAEGILEYNTRTYGSNSGSDWSGYNSYEKVNVDEGIRRLLPVDKRVLFRELKAGDWFKWEDTLFVKTHGASVNVINFGGKHKENVWIFHCDDLVLPVKVSIKEEQ